MTYPTKIATCCFCGSKAALTLGEGRHELACAQCGAPLHDLKQIPVPQPQKPVQHAPTLRRFPAAAGALADKKPKKKMRKPKKQKHWMNKIGKDFLDVIDDLID